MSRLAVRCGILFVLLLFVVPTSDMVPFAPPYESVNASVSALLEPLQEAGEKERLAAGRGSDSAWVKSGNPESLPLLIRYLGGSDEIVQLASLAECAGMGAKAKSAVPAILAILNNSKSSIRVDAAATLIHMNVQSQDAIRTLQKELKSEDAMTRAHVARTIGELVQPSEILGTSCWGPDPPPRVARPWVGKRTLPALVEALRDQTPRVRMMAAHTLGLLGPDARSAIPVLTKALTDEDKAVRDSAEEAIQRINRLPSSTR